MKDLFDRPTPPSNFTRTEILRALLSLPAPAGFLRYMQNIGEPTLGKKISRSLQEEGVHTVYDLSTMEKINAKRLRRVGKTALGHLESWLHEFGLQFGMIVGEELRPRREPDSPA
jgi:hypothetical protein